MSPELSNPDQTRLPAVTQDVIDELDSKGYSTREAVGFMERSDPFVSDTIQVYLAGMAATHSERLLAYQTAAYLYTLLNEAQNKKDQA